MVKRTINLNSVDKVKEFVRTISQYEFDVDLGSGRYVIDAKSIMGVYSLDLSKNIECLIHGNDAECTALLDAITPFCV